MLTSKLVDDCPFGKVFSTRSIPLEGNDLSSEALSLPPQNSSQPLKMSKHCQAQLIHMCNPPSSFLIVFLQNGF